MHLEVKTEDIEFTVMFDGTEKPDGAHFVFVSNLLETLGVTVPEFVDLAADDAEAERRRDAEIDRWEAAQEDAAQAREDPSTWAQMVADVAQLLYPEQRDAALKAFADEMNKRGVGTSSEAFRIEGGQWLDDIKHKAALWDQYVEKLQGGAGPMEDTPDLTVAGKAAQQFDAASPHIEILGEDGPRRVNYPVAVVHGAKKDEGGAVLRDVWCGSTEPNRAAAVVTSPASAKNVTCGACKAAMPRELIG